MPLNAAKVGLAVQGGMSVVCATCERYWEGRDRGLPEPRCTSQRGCGSPLAGKDFPDYRGPISQFDRWCFVCGDPAKYGVRVNGGKVFGMCPTHIEYINSMRPENHTNGYAHEILAANPRDLAMFYAPKPKSLMAEIAKTEAEFRKIEAERDQG